MARRSRSARTTAGSTSPSPASPRPGCRWSTSTASAARRTGVRGASFVLNADCSLVVDARIRGGCGGHHWQRTLRAGAARRVGAPLMTTEGIYHAMTLGLRDYVTRNHFPGIVIGMSGGIDSALSAAVAVDALGADKVWCVMMPSRFTSPESLEDAAACATALGVRLDSIGIEPAVGAFDTMLGPTFEGRNRDITEENIQGAGARHHADGDLQQVRADGADHRQQVGDVDRLPPSIATCAAAIRAEGRLQDHGVRAVPLAQRPCAERRAGARRRGDPERSSLPPTASCARTRRTRTAAALPVLDAILRGLEEECSVETLVARGHDATTVARQLLYVAEYKRRPGTASEDHAAQLRPRRRYPITNAFRTGADAPVVTSRPRPPVSCVGNLRTAIVNALFGGQRRPADPGSTTPTPPARARTMSRASAPARWLGIRWDAEERQSARTAACEGGLRATQGQRPGLPATNAGRTDIRARSSSRGLPPIYDRAALDDRGGSRG